MRRLPVYILIQYSGAMKGEPIESIKVGLEAMVSSLRQDPFALESVYISIITYNRKPEILVGLTELESLQIPEIVQPESGPPLLGEAIDFICKQIDSEVILSTPDKKGDWMPLLFIMSDGRAADTQFFNQTVPTLKRKNLGSIVSCLVGSKTDVENIKKITDKIVSLETTDSNTFKQFFKWVSASVSVGNRSIGATDTMLLPPPPPEINMVL